MHSKNFVISFVLAFSIFAGSMALNEASPHILKMHNDNLHTSFFGNTDITAKNTRRYFVVRADGDPSYDSVIGEYEDVIYLPEKEGTKSVCLYEQPAEVTYLGEIVTVEKTDSIGPAEEFTVTVSVKNTGTAAWFSRDSGCKNHVEVALATAKDYGRTSIFGTDDYATSGWIHESRVEMVEDVVYAGETATFTFTSVTPWGDVWYKEFFVPVAEGVRYMDEAMFGVDILVGDEANFDAGVMDLIDYSTDSFQLTGEKWISIDLSDQAMRLYVGEVLIADFQVSSGKASTPTPAGTYYILNKQELRIGGEWPYYRMPYWMGFTSSGHGIHALPYLANDGGAFWYEALEHIGTPVSHGCVRTLPEDAVKIYAFGEIGMRVTIQR